MTKPYHELMDDLNELDRVMTRELNDAIYIQHRLPLVLHSVNTGDASEYSLHDQVGDNYVIYTWERLPQGGYATVLLEFPPELEQALNMSAITVNFTLAMDYAFNRLQSIQRSLNAYRHR